MDSKSISREGSRGSSPRPGTSAAEAGEDLARALLSVLLHELNNHTQVLAAYRALAADPGALDGRADALARTGREVEELGWLLGLCAGGLGTDLLFERSERLGLAPLVRLVRAALRRAGRDLERADRALPELDPRLGWRAAWAVGVLLHAAASATAEPLAWELEARADALVLDVRAPPAALAERVARAGSASPRGADWTRFLVERGVRA